MATILNLFPARVRFTNVDGTLTAEAIRALLVLTDRVGGPTGSSTIVINDFSVEQQFMLMGA